MGKSRFCDQLFYWRITRTCRTNTGWLPCMLTVPVSGVVIRLTFAERSRPTITTSQTVYRLQSFRIKGFLSSGVTFQASHRRGWGSAKKMNNEQFICLPSHIRTGSQRYHRRHASLDLVCTWPSGPHIYLSIWPENEFICMRRF